MSDMTRSGHRQFIEAGERKYQERKNTMPNVKTVQDRTKGALLIMDDGMRIWTPDKELARTLLGKPIPEDWTRRDNENGPMALPPKPKGGGGLTAWRNTKEGFEAEATGRRRWQEIEEEKKDRRTALMQAVQTLEGGHHTLIIEYAELFYDWLRESSPAAGPAVATAGAATTAEETTQPSAIQGQARARGAAPGGQAGGTMSGEGRASSSRRGDGLNTHSASGSPVSETPASSPGTTSAPRMGGGDKPGVRDGDLSGSRRVGAGTTSGSGADRVHNVDAPDPGTTSGPAAAVKAAVQALGLDPGLDSTPAASGEVAAAPEPGEDARPKPSPGSTTYPMSPEECDHKFASGGWLKTRQVEGVPVCPRCGMSAVLYRES